MNASLCRCERSEMGRSRYLQYLLYRLMPIDVISCNIYSTISLQVIRCSITSPAHRYQHGLIRRHKRLPIFVSLLSISKSLGFPAKLCHCKPNERTPQATKLGLRKSLPVSPIKCNFIFFHQTWMPCNILLYLRLLQFPSLLPPFH